MNKKNIYIFFIIVALIFWNPISFYIIYGGTDLIDITILNYFFGLTLFAGIAIIVLINRNKLNDFFKNVSLSFALTGIIFALFVFVNLSIGLMIQESRENSTNLKRLMFNPNTKAVYKTIEFDFISEINSIGLRDKEFDIEKKNKYRIVCFGDSWTYGWGVNIDDIWPKRLEALLHEQGLDQIEVINCGQGGAFTAHYRTNLPEVVELLEPDLVLIGVLQADDLVQSYQGTFFHKPDNHSLTRITIYIKESFYSFLVGSFNNFIKLFRDDNQKILDIEENWKLTSLEEISNLNEFQRLRFSTLNDSLKYLIETGNLNPSLFWIYINFPERNLIINDPKNPATIIATREMQKDFLEMKTICEKNSIDLIFVNLPEAAFTGHKVIRTPQQKVFDEYLYTHNYIDSIYKSIADYVNIPYIELTERFKQLESKSSYFFRYDGHPNKKGYEEISAGISTYLINEFDLREKYKRSKNGLN